MALERPSDDRSLELDDVVQRFAASTALLEQVGQQLESLQISEAKSNARARSLSEAARAVEGYSASAKPLLDEVKQNARRANEILQAGARLLDNSALAELRAAVAALREAQAAAQAETQQDLVALRHSHVAMGDRLLQATHQSHVKHTRRLLIATVLLLAGQAAAVAVVVAVVLSL